jgi:carboxyl-terminal processing protease
LDEDISGQFGGIGVEIDNRDGYLTIVSPLPETPAEAAGLKPKDIIAEIEGQDSISMPSSEAVKIMRGEPGTLLNIKVARKGNIGLIDVQIKRAVINIPIIKTYNKDGVFVIKIFSFTKNSPELFFDAVKEFAKTNKKKLIIDMRGNPGGHLFASVYIAGLFLPKDTIIVTQDYGDKKDKEVLKSGKYHKSDKTINIFSDKIQIGVLLNAGSASASEILAGALHDNNRAVLLGEKTFGKGTVQQLKKLADGTSLKYTIAR